MDRPRGPAAPALRPQRPPRRPAPLGTVSGQIRLDGQPLADATVFFSPEGGGRTSVGRTDAKADAS